MERILTYLTILKKLNAHRTEVEVHLNGMGGYKKRVFVVSQEELDGFFQKLSAHTGEMLPDGIVDINVKVLHGLHLLSEESPIIQETPPSSLLQAIDSGGKITLYNEKFALWIVPQANATPPTTITFIARRTEEGIAPEVAFRTQGIHNRSKTILRLIDRYLAEIQETESVIAGLENPPPSPEKLDS